MPLGNVLTRKCRSLLRHTPALTRTDVHLTRTDALLSQRIAVAARDLTRPLLLVLKELCLTIRLHKSCLNQSSQ